MRHIYFIVLIGGVLLTRPAFASVTCEAARRATTTTLAPNVFSLQFAPDTYTVATTLETDGLVTKAIVRARVGATTFNLPFTSYTDSLGCAFWKFYVLPTTAPTVVWRFVEVYKDEIVISSHYEIDAARLSGKHGWQWMATEEAAPRARFKSTRRLEIDNVVYWDRPRDAFYFEDGNGVRRWEPGKQGRMSKSRPPLRDLEDLSFYLETNDERLRNSRGTIIGMPSSSTVLGGNLDRLFPPPLTDEAGRSRNFDFAFARRVFKQKQAALYACHDRSPKFKEKIVVRFTVDPADGRVLETGGTFSSASGSNASLCIFEVVQGLRFRPYIGKPVRLSWPLAFKSDFE